jgi:hypothetical protein
LKDWQKKNKGDLIVLFRVGVLKRAYCGGYWDMCGVE